MKGNPYKNIVYYLTLYYLQNDIIADRCYNISHKLEYTIKLFSVVYAHVTQSWNKQLPSGFFLPGFIF